MNWTAWLEWATEHQARALFVLFLFLKSDVIFALLSGAYLLRMRNRIAGNGGRIFIGAVGWLLLGMGGSRICEFIAAIDGPRGVHYSDWFSWWYWLSVFLQWLPCLILSIIVFYDRSRE